MAKAKQEDGRDIFDKVADVVVPVAGAYVGGRAGARIWGGSKKAVRAYKKAGDQATVERDKVYDRIASGKARKTDAEDLLYHENQRRWNYDDWGRRDDRRTWGWVAGGATGAAGGMVLRKDGRGDKRRK